MRPRGGGGETAARPFPKCSPLQQRNELLLRILLLDRQSGAAAVAGSDHAYRRLRTVTPLEVGPALTSETPMYLVEIEAGREALYDSTSALAAAIRRGEVGPQARIFHRTSSSWISITLHPEFRKAAAARLSEPLPPLARSQWTFFGVEPIGREIDEPPAAGGDAGQPTAKTTESHGRLRNLLGRAFRSFSSTTKTSETAGS